MLYLALYIVIGIIVSMSYNFYKGKATHSFYDRGDAFLTMLFWPLVLLSDIVMWHTKWAFNLGERNRN